MHSHPSFQRIALRDLRVLIERLERSDDIPQVSVENLIVPVVIEPIPRSCLDLYVETITVVSPGGTTMKIVRVFDFLRIDQILDRLIS